MDVLPEVPMEPVFPMESPSTSALRLEEEISLSLQWTCTFGRHNLVVFPAIVILAVLPPVQWTLFDFWFTRSRWNKQATIRVALLTKVAWIAQLNLEHVLKFLRPDNFMQLLSRDLFWKFVAAISSSFRNFHCRNTTHKRVLDQNTEMVGVADVKLRGRLFFRGKFQRNGNTNVRIRFVMYVVPACIKPVLYQYLVRAPYE